MALVVSAFAAAYLAQDSGMLSLTPPPSDAVPNPSPDALGKELALELEEKGYSWIEGLAEQGELVTA